uniref:Uncharacterized protein n=1 Tax=viral metagenome TaxID=1070528 RepID=A0A6C0AEB1_9ZZZZ
MTITLEKIWNSSPEELRIPNVFSANLEKRQRFILKKPLNLNPKKTLYKNLRNNNIEFTLKDIWKMKNKSLEEILENSKIPEKILEDIQIFKNDPDKILRITVALLYKHEKLIDIDVDNTNFIKNMYYSESFDEGINIQDLSKNEILEYIYDQKITPSHLKKFSKLDINLSDYNAYIIKKIIENLNLKNITKKYNVFMELMKNNELKNKILSKKSLKSILFLSPLKEKVFNLFINFNISEEQIDKIKDYRFNYFNSDNIYIIFDYLNLKEKYPSLILNIHFFDTIGSFFEKIKVSPFKYLDILISKNWSVDIINSFNQWIQGLFTNNSGAFNHDEEFEEYINFYLEDLTDIFYFIRICISSYINENNFEEYIYFSEDLLNIFLKIKNLDLYNLKPLHYKIFNEENLYEIFFNKNGEIFDNFINFLFVYTKIYNNKFLDNKKLRQLFLLISSSNYLFKEDIIDILGNIEENLENPYTQFLNVHHGNRDFKTDQIIFELIKITKKINIDKYFKKFEKYLKSKDNQKILDKTIYGKNRKKTDFEGILQGKVKIFDEYIEGKDLLSRFWYFASKKEDLKNVIIEELLNSFQKCEINQNSYVVCNPGKFQRLAVGVLQGRIKDSEGNLIMIDETNEKENKELIINYNEIKFHLDKYFNQYPINNLNYKEFFFEIFDYIKELSEDNIVNLSYPHVVYYLCMLAETKNGLEMIPDLSIISNFDVDLTEKYVEVFGKDDAGRYV